jgi:hypothetical protein
VGGQRPLRGRFVGGTPRKPPHFSANRSRPGHPAIPITEPNPALSGRPQPLPASSETSIGETGFEPATARPPAGCATRLRHSPWLAKRATGIEPALEAWKASVQPQHFARSPRLILPARFARHTPAAGCDANCRRAPRQRPRLRLPALLAGNLSRVVRQPRRRPRTAPVIARAVERDRRAVERAPERGGE